MLKKLLIISSSLLLIVIIALVAYNFIGKKDTVSGGNTNISNVDNETNGKNNNNDNQNNSVSDKIIEFSSEPTLGAILTYDKTAVKYYHRDTGNVYQKLLDGSSQKTVSAAVLKDLIDVKWSPNKDQVIAVYKDLSYPHQKKFVFFDYNTKKSAMLNKNIDDVIWLPSGAQISYYFLDLDNNIGNIAVAQPDGTGWKKILDLNIRGAVLDQVPDQAKVSFHLTPTAYRESSLQTISTLGGNPTTLLKDKFGLDAKWSPDGTKALVSITKKRAGNEITLGIVDTTKNYQFEELNIATTINKAVWSEDGKFIYFALPEIIPDDSAMPDDYLSKSVRTADTFWRYELKNKKKEQITFKDDSKIIYDATYLFLSPKNSQLFFTNRDDGKLYYVKM